MSDSAERFIEIAIRPLGDNAELEVAGRHALEESIAGAGQTAGDPLAAATARLEATDRKPWGKAWRIGWYVVVAIVSALIWGKALQSTLLARQASQILGIFGFGMGGSGLETIEKQLGRGLTAKQKLLLLGDTQRRGKAECFKALWESEPQNPAYFADYTVAHLSERASLPPDFLETARELDPDNSWFTLIAASEAARASMDPRYPVSALSPGGLKLKTIIDPAKLDEAVALLHESASKKRFDSYQIALLKQRIPLLPKRTDTLDQTVALAYVAGLTAPNFRLRQLADAVSAKSIQLARDKDVEGFRRLLADWDAISGILIHSEQGTLVDVLINVVMIRGPLKAMREAATDLGLAEEEAALKELDDRFESWKRAAGSRTDPNKDMALRSGFFAGLSMPVASKRSAHSPVIQPEDLKPGRLADHALAGRAMSLTGWLILGLFLLAAGLYRFRGSVLTRRLSERMASLLRPADWMWILLIGIVLPPLYYHAIYRFTPFGAREWSLKASVFMVPAGQFSAMLWLMIVLPVMMARKRLDLRAGAAGLASKGNTVAWVAVTMGVAALPAFGASFFPKDPSQALLIVAGVLLGLLQLYALVIGIRATFSRQTGLLRRVTLSRILLPVYATGLLLMAAMVPLYHAEERHWMARDRLSEIAVDEPSLTRFEYQVTQAMRQDLLELVTGKP